MNVTMDQRYCSSRTIYCVKCGYILNGVSSDQCPECGAGFSLHRPETYTTIRKRWYKKYFDIVMPLVLTCMGVVLGFISALLLVGMLARLIDGAWLDALVVLGFAVFYGLLGLGV